MTAFLKVYFLRLLFWVAIVTLIRLGAFELFGMRLRADLYVFALVLAISGAGEHRIQAGHGQFRIHELAIASIVVSLAYFIVTVGVRLLSNYFLGFNDGLSAASLENHDVLLLAAQFMLGFNVLLALVLIPLTIFLKKRGWY